MKLRQPHKKGTYAPSFAVYQGTAEELAQIRYDSLSKAEKQKIARQDRANARVQAKAKAASTPTPTIQAIKAELRRASEQAEKEARVRLATADSWLFITYNGPVLVETADKDAAWQMLIAKHPDMKIKYGLYMDEATRVVSRTMHDKVVEVIR